MRWAFCFQEYNPPQMALNSGSRLGPYEILAPLGAGGMGEVYRARDTRLERTVAIKILPVLAPPGGNQSSGGGRKFDGSMLCMRHFIAKP
jgi:hypothetical protein